MKLIVTFIFISLLFTGCGKNIEDLLSEGGVQGKIDSNFCLKNKENAPFASGDGSTESPYRICTLSHFNEVASNASYLDKYFELYANLDFSATAINSIGANGAGFTGSFDGRSYSLSNITIAEPATSYVGIFRKIEATGVVKNLTLNNVSIVGGSYTGAVTGYSAGNIINTQVSGTVTGASNTGGLVGRVWVASALLGVSDSSSSAAINGGTWTGGIVGWSRGATYDNNYSTGSVTGANRTGGLIGVTDGSSVIKNSYATGDVHSPSYLVGGLIGGGNATTIDNCYATGAVTSDDSWIGGLIGTLNGTVSRSYSTSSVSTPTGESVGGIAGYIYAGSTVTDTYFTGSLEANKYVGGIVGYNEGATIVFSISTSANINTALPAGLQGGGTGPLANTNFWDSEISSVPGDYIDDMTTLSTVQARTTAQMKSVSTFTGAGFDQSIWKLIEGSYPTFK